MFKRWYDKDAALSLAISLIQSAKPEERRACAEFIIKSCREEGIDLSLNFFESLQYQMKRWYDQEKTLFEALEYLKVSPVEVRKKVVVQVIDLLQNSKVTV